MSEVIGTHLYNSHKLREALEQIAKAHDEWDPDAAFASTALYKAAALAKEALSPGDHPGAGGEA